MSEPARQIPQSLPQLSRRRLLAGGLGAAALAALAAPTMGSSPAFATSTGTVLPLVEPLPEGAPDRALFAPKEQIFAGYLMILAPLANSVVDDDPERYGWMEDGWWRGPVEPFNARIMEQVSTLSWFYANERPWNPYYLDANLLGRLDAALGWLLGLQNEDGSYPEYSLGEHGLAPTSFGTVNLAWAYHDLQAVGALPERRAEMATALRKASAWLMALSNPIWNIPVRATNQVASGLAGVAHTADVLGDPSIAANLDARIARLAEHGQAPAGYFHEVYGSDIGYSFEVMIPDLGDLYLLTRHPRLVEMVNKYAEFLGYVTVREPDSPGSYRYVASNSRTYDATWIELPYDDPTPRTAVGDKWALDRVFLAEVPAMRAYFAPAEDKIAWRKAWATNPDPVEPLIPNRNDPRLFRHVMLAPIGVSRTEYEAAIAAQPYLRNELFTELREGTIDQHFLFVRRKPYYLASLYGVRDPLTNLNRMGPGMLWHPHVGMVIFSLNSPADASWSSLTASGQETARSSLAATYHDGVDASTPQVAKGDVGALVGVFTIRYIRAGGAITTDITHWHDGVVWSTQAGEDSTERIPLVLRSDDILRFADGTMSVSRSP